MVYTVYILYSESLERYYTGHTHNLDDRLARHNHGRSKATKSGTPWQLVYTETCPTRSEAMRREQQIKKKKSRHYIETLIQGG